MKETGTPMVSIFFIGLGPMDNIEIVCTQDLLFHL